MIDCGALESVNFHWQFKNFTTFDEASHKRLYIKTVGLVQSLPLYTLPQNPRWKQSIFHTIIHKRMLYAPMFVLCEPKILIKSCIYAEFNLHLGQQTRWDIALDGSYYFIFCMLNYFISRKGSERELCVFSHPAIPLLLDYQVKRTHSKALESSDKRKILMTQKTIS